MKIQTILGAGIGVGITTSILSWIYKTIFPSGIGSTTFSILPLDIPLRQQIQEGLNTDLVSKLLSAISGGKVLPFEGLILTVLAGIAIVGLGFLIVPLLQNLGVPIGKLKPTGKNIAHLFGGTIATALIFGFMATNGKVVIPALGAMFSWIIYFGIVSVVYGWISTQIKALPKLSE